LPPDALAATLRRQHANPPNQAPLNFTLNIAVSALHLTDLTSLLQAVANSTSHRLTTLRISNLDYVERNLETLPATLRSLTSLHKIELSAHKAELGAQTSKAIRLSTGRIGHYFIKYGDVAMMGDRAIAECLDLMVSRLANARGTVRPLI
jgi:hypothetical protein